MLKAGLCSPVSIIPEKPFFVLHPSFLLKAVICLFRGQMMLFHIWLQIMFMKEECAAMSEKKIRGAVIGVTDDGCLTLELEGRLDTTTAPELENVIKKGLEGVDRLVLDMEGLAYLSSAGLRVILAAQKQMNRQGTMTVRNVCGTIMEVFEVTGFTDILTIE